MRLVFFILFITLASQARDLSNCKNVSQKTWAACSKQLLEFPAWSPLKENLKSAKEKSNGLISTNYDPKLHNSGLAKLEKNGHRAFPVIIFGSYENLNELLITFNHELVHYNNLFTQEHLAFDVKKLKNCITPYRLELLKDETRAFLAEIQFWKNAPVSFRESFKNKFSSRLLKKTVSYSEYYKLLEEKLMSDSKFIEKRYIEMNEYPSCARELI